jgi:hypothetical protein
VQSAEQIALSLQSLAAAMTRQNPALLQSPLTRAIDDLFADLRDRDAYDAASFTRKLRALGPRQN